MKATNKKILLAVGITAVAALAIYAVRRSRNNRRHARASDEGYETAYDVLYPGKNYGQKRLILGPVLPE